MDDPQLKTGRLVRASKSPRNSQPRELEKKTELVAKAINDTSVKPVLGNSFDDTPTGGSKATKRFDDHAKKPVASIFDDTPIGGKGNSSFDDTPISSAQKPNNAFDDTPIRKANSNNNKFDETPLKSNDFDNTPIGGGAKYHNPVEEMPLGGRKNPFDDTPLGTRRTSNPLDKIIEPSVSAMDSSSLNPCPTCSRTFLLPALERHMKICKKVSTTKRKVFDVTNKRTDGLEKVPTKSPSVVKKKSSRIEDEFKKCPHCERKFGPKPYDRHVKWCEEKNRRMQDSPKKDLLALAKLHARTAYRPKTPGKRDAKEGSPARKYSVASSIPSESPLPYFDNELGHRMSGSLSRSESRNSRRSLERKSSNGGNGISYINTVEHTKETPETNFIRAVTGRGSIKRGPAPTKASQLRQLVREMCENMDSFENVC